MTYAKTDPATMTNAEVADYQQRVDVSFPRAEAATPAEATPGSDQGGETISIRFTAEELTCLRARSDAAGTLLASWVRRVALDEAGWPASA